MIAFIGDARLRGMVKREREGKNWALKSDNVMIIGSWYNFEALSSKNLGHVGGCREE